MISVPTCLLGWLEEQMQFVAVVDVVKAKKRQKIQMKK